MCFGFRFFCRDDDETNGHIHLGPPTHLGPPPWWLAAQGNQTSKRHASQHGSATWSGKVYVPVPSRGMTRPLPAAEVMAMTKRTKRPPWLTEADDKHMEYMLSGGTVGRPHPSVARGGHEGGDDWMMHYQNMMSWGAAPGPGYAAHYNHMLKHGRGGMPLPPPGHGRGGHGGHGGGPSGSGLGGVFAEGGGRGGRGGHGGHSRSHGGFGHPGEHGDGPGGSDGEEIPPEYEEMEGAGGSHGHMGGSMGRGRGYGMGRGRGGRRGRGRGSGRGGVPGRGYGRGGYF
ncbi:MAG: hypothetical protein M1820_010743 [Bogoriella megaspora]|nr:MAG: hypothetical protein M1820_010743 [Bogoriella megaspora]